MQEKLDTLINEFKEAHNTTDILKKLNKLFYKLRKKASKVLSSITWLDVTAQRVKRTLNKVDINQMSQIASGVTAILKAMERIKETAALQEGYIKSTTPILNSAQTIRTDHEALTEQVKAYIEEIHTKLAKFVTEIEEGQTITDPRSELNKQGKSLSKKVDDLVTKADNVMQHLHKSHQEIFSMLPPSHKKDFSAKPEQTQQQSPEQS